MNWKIFNTRKRREFAAHFPFVFAFALLAATMQINAVITHGWIALLYGPACILFVLVMATIFAGADWLCTKLIFGPVQRWIDSL